MKRPIKFLLAGFALAAAVPAAHAVFDPVGEDTDIFLANPTYAATKPNVLIMMDNTANWNSVFSAEKNALLTAANTIFNDNFRVGLGMFPETGSPNDSIDGAYIRFGTRTMDTANRNALFTLVNGLDQSADKGNNATFSLMMYESYAYFAGIDSRSGFGKFKRDAAGNTSGNSVAAGLAGNPFASTSATRYTSPIQDACQKNFIIVVSNGPANDNSSSLSTAESLLGGLTGQSPPATIALKGYTGEQSNWMDEYAKFMANNDCNSFFLGKQSVSTYAIDIRQQNRPADFDHSTLLESAAVQGRGRYILIDTTVSGTDVEQKLKDALKSIFDEIQAVNSIFASVTLPVSVNVRGTNLNQVYIGVFRPDASRKPRWFGNLKLYDLGVTAGGVLFLADASNGPPPAQGVRAENPDTGFISNTAKSFWTTALTGGNEFWSFRTPFDVTDIGQGKDLPDGDLVEKGGAAQRLREVYETSQTSRKVYTCIGTGCVSGADMSADSTLAFSTANTSNITAALLGTFDTKPVTSLTSAANLATATVAGHGYSVGDKIIISGAVPDLYNSTSSPTGDFTISAVTLNTFTYDLGTTPSATIAQVSAPNHKLQTGDIVVVDSVEDAFDTPSTGASITVPTGNNSTFSYDIATAPLLSPASPNTVTAKRNVTQLYSTGTTATVTLLNHQFGVSPTVSTVSIEGAAESEFNRSNVAITVLDSNNFTYQLASAPTKPSNKVEVTTTTTHGFNTGDTVSISGASDSNYNTTTVITRVNATKFTYPVSGLIADATGGTAQSAGTTLNVTNMSHASGSGIVTVTTSAAHGLNTSDSVSISGSTYPQYNGSFTVTAVPSSTTLQIQPTVAAASTVPNPTASTNAGMSATVGATVRSVSSIDHGSGGNANTVTVTVTAASHGFAVNDVVIIAGADKAPYNGAWIVSRISGGGLGSNQFQFVNAGTAANWPTPAAGTITAGTAKSAAISTLKRIVDATNSATQGPIRVVRSLSGTTISKQTTATGNPTITVANKSFPNNAERDLVINWVRGEENNEDEDKNEASGATNNRNGTTPFTVRSTIHGDVLHSRPAVINYNRSTTDNDVYIFYGANDGLLHAVKGGYATTADSILNPGDEAWSFVPQEFYGRLKRLRDNAPTITGLSRRDYFFDGPIAVYTWDKEADAKLQSDATHDDKVYMYVGMRRGGRMLYAFDVSKPEAPKYMWKVGCPNVANNTGCTAGFEELGQTWSEPRIGWIRAHSNPVLIFGAGYDPDVGDIHPCLVTATSATTVTRKVGGSVTFTSSGDCMSTTLSGTPINRRMGRGIYIVDALNGALVRYIGGGTIDSTLASTKMTTVSGMTYAIPADVTVLNRDRDTSAHPGITSGRESVSRGFLDRIYAGDMGGNVWRIDMDNSDPSAWVVTRLASISDSSTVSVADTRPTGTRKFMFAPDVVFTSDSSPFDAVIIGSGDREHPFDSLIVNRFYMFKDRKTGLDATGQGDSASPWTPAITESDLFDVTSNCLQANSTCSDAQRSQATTDLIAAKGWKLNLLTGEKTVSSAITLAGTTFFNTNQPSAVQDALKCASNLGIAREYALSYKDATATTDLDGRGGVTTADRSAVHEGGGFLPSPVPVIVQIGDDKYQGVISGTSVRDPGGLTLEKRLRMYWYRKVE